MPAAPRDVSVRYKESREVVLVVTLALLNVGLLLMCPSGIVFVLMQQKKVTRER
jgi:hypothetical protein